MGTESPTPGGPGGGGFDISSINRNDLGVMIAGLVALIASFLPYYKVELSGGGISLDSSISAWHSYATVGMLLIIAGVAVIAVKTFAAHVLPSNLPVGLHVLAAVLIGLGTLLVILRAFTIDDVSGPGVDSGVAWGGWLLFIAGIVATVFAVLGMRESGEKLPEFRGGAGSPPPPAA